METLDWSRQALTAESLVEKLARLEVSSNYDTLNLNDNNIKSLKGVTFPAWVGCLYLGGNKIETLKGVTFPDALKYIYLKGNHLSQEEICDLPYGVKLLHLKKLSR